MRFRKIEPGAFTMGSPSPSPLGSLFHSLGMLSDQEVGANQSPKTEVRITSSYYFARRTVTVEEYAMFLNDRTTSEDRAPAAIARDYLADPGVPWAKPHIVVNEQGLFGPAPGSGGGGCIFLSATFDGARAFAEWFGQEADLPRGLRAALPTEAEWAFAARGENSRVYPWGNTPPPQVGLDRYIVVLSPAGSSLKAYHCVKPLQSPDGATPCGIHDLIGPCEWTSDYYAERLPGGSVVDPVGPRRPAAERSATGSTMRVVRGCGDADFKAAGRSARFEDRGARIRLVLRRR